MPPAVHAPSSWGGSHPNIAITFGRPYGKTRMTGVPESEKSFTIHLLILLQYTNFTDGQTDGHHRMT